jgi:hypothetical protein
MSYQSKGIKHDIFLGIKLGLISWFLFWFVIMTPILDGSTDYDPYEGLTEYTIDILEGR